MKKNNVINDIKDWNSGGYDKGRRTRRQIVAAASALFAAAGYAATSIDEIATACGMTKGAIYAHFKRKRTLYLACVEDCLTFFRDPAPVDTSMSKARALEHYLFWMGKNFSEHATTRALMIQIVLEQKGDAAESQLIQDILGPPFAQFRTIISAANQSIDSAAYAFYAFSVLLLDSDLHKHYRLMDAAAARKHNIKTTAKNLAKMIANAG